MSAPIPLVDVLASYQSKGRQVSYNAGHQVDFVRDSIRSSKKIQSLTTGQPNRFEMSMTLTKDLDPHQLIFTNYYTDVKIISEHPSLANQAVGVLLNDKMKPLIDKITADIKDVNRRVLRRHLTDLIEKYGIENFVLIHIQDFQLEVAGMSGPKVEI